jgi:hypothetical protein
MDWEIIIPMVGTIWGFLQSFVGLFNDFSENRPLGGLVNFAFCWVYAYMSYLIWWR